jgi:hypothetical protein
MMVVMEIFNGSVNDIDDIQPQSKT